VAVPGTAFEGAERALGQSLAAAHHGLAERSHARPVALDDILVRPALQNLGDPARRSQSRAGGLVRIPDKRLFGFHRHCEQSEAIARS
jgi:hypothetical protein